MAPKRPLEEPKGEKNKSTIRSAFGPRGLFSPYPRRNTRFQTARMSLGRSQPRTVYSGAARNTPHSNHTDVSSHPKNTSSDNVAR